MKENKEGLERYPRCKLGGKHCTAVTYTLTDCKQIAVLCLSWQASYGREVLSLFLSTSHLSFLFSFPLLSPFYDGT